MPALQAKPQTPLYSTTIIPNQRFSPDLPHYVMMLKQRIGTPSLIVCLDSGCGNYDAMWITTSLRGLAGGNLKVTILKEGVHSGSSSGVVPSSFRIVRQLLSRIEDEESGK